MNIFNISHKDHQLIVNLSTNIMPLQFCHDAVKIHLLNTWKVKELLI
jgi:hypothetical protein